MNKRKWAAALSLVLLLILSACGNGGSPSPSGSSSAGANQAAESEAAANINEDNGKILIAYFTAAENSGEGVDAVTTASYSTIGGTAVGRLRAIADMIADMIAEHTGGELFSIQTSVVYPTDIGELIDYAAQEQDEYDFTGKTIIPFNVHNGSGLSRTVQTIQELEPEADVIEDAFTISERNVEDAAGEINSWLDGLGY